MKAHLFDADGVIFDSEPAHAAAYIEYAKRSGIELSEERFMTELRGQNGSRIMSTLFPDETAERISERVDEQNALFRSEFLDRIHLIEGVEPYLETLITAGLSVLIVSNGARANIEAMLTTFSIDLPAIAIEDFTRPKPNPAGYLKALEILGVSARDAVVYEDTEIGVLAGRRAGIRVIGVSGSCSQDALRRAGADAVINDFTAFQIP
jgi:beta-phosphoglucomutase